MQIQAGSFARCAAALVALASMGYAAPGNNSNNSRSTMLAVTSPQPGATVKGLSLKVDIQVHQAARRPTFRARLNGKDITARFAGSGACQKERCPESAILTPLDGLIEGRNVLRLRIKKWNGNFVHTRTVFMWSQSNPPVSGGVGTAVPGIFQPNYSFTTLQPGGYQGNGQPWFQISSNALGTVTKNYPKNPIQCTNSVYLLVEIQRTSLQELSSTCLDSAGLDAALSAIPSTSFAVLGSLAGINADWSNLNPSAIGGSDYRQVGDQEAPWGYMMVGIGKAPSGIGLESYNTGYERAEAELAQIHGVLTANAYGMYDLHPSDNAIVNVDGVNKRVQIDGVTYTPPAVSANVPSGFWVLPITRRTLSPTTMVNQDNSGCPASCGAVFYLNSPQDAINMTDYLSSVPVRSLIFVIAWGKQAGLDSSVQQDQTLYTRLSNLGIPAYTFTKMSDSTSSMAAVVSNDQTVSRNLQFSREAYVSSTQSAFDQHGQLSLVLSRDAHYLQRPVSGVQNNFDPSPGHMTIDLSFLKTVWQPASPWPMMDTPGRVNAYQYLSYMMFHTVWPANQQPSNTGNDIRSIYDEPFVAMDLAGVDPTNPASYPFPQGGTYTRPDNGVTYTFTQQDLSDVAQQVKAELGALDRVLNLFGNEGVNLRGLYVDNEVSLVDILLSELAGSARAANDQRPELIFRLSDVTNWTASMTGITSLPQMQAGSGYLYGAMSGLFHAMSSSGLLDPRGDGIPDYTVAGTVQSVYDNLAAYSVNADAAYETVFSNIVQDWSKLNALSQFADPGQQENYLRQSQSTAVLMQLAARRYFNTMVMAFKWQIDQFYGVQATQPSNIGTWFVDGHYNTSCKGNMYNDNPATAWAVLPSVTAPGSNDIFIVAGRVSNNWTDFMTVGGVPAGLTDPIFQKDSSTGMPGLPPEVWFGSSPVQFRPISARPSWSIDYDQSICAVGATR
ncbi:hypothetical protein [uncultured Paludibaculum sp.]|uniref:hypothetical protein n=1 Tax=uncultured Paludibaculum sp. TaxID=1765020 RepID=UPI002AAAB9B0|nr:hypothetical protein [uncultured Paludibaculum sp.]